MYRIELKKRNKEKNKTEFLKDFKTRLKANYSIIVEKIKSSL